MNKGGDQVSKQLSRKEQFRK